LTQVRRCPYCQDSFQPSIYRPQQTVCSNGGCQRRRRSEYHREKLQADPEYRQVARDSQKKWRQAHPGYDQNYRAQHPEYHQRNREQQQLRDQKRRFRRLAKNNLALDLKRSAAEVWLLTAKAENLAKNNLASAEVLIFQSLKRPPLSSAKACKEQLSSPPP
jgi:hypothetical protein